MQVWQLQYQTFIIPFQLSPVATRNNVRKAMPKFLKWACSLSPSHGSSTEHSTPHTTHNHTSTPLNTLHTCHTQSHIYSTDYTTHHTQSHTYSSDYTTRHTQSHIYSTEYTTTCKYLSLAQYPYTTTLFFSSTLYTITLYFTKPDAPFLWSSLVSH